MISIDKKSIATLPLAHFDGRIHVLDNATDALKAVAYLSKQRVLGFDTETRPSFHKGDNHRVALIQLSTDSECFLFRINRTGFTEPLIKLMENEEVMKVGLSTKDDLHGLNLIATFNPGGIIELQQLVKQYEIVDMSLQRIYAILFNQHISKGQRLTNWEAPTLTHHQQAYAALDAWACLRIYKYLSAGLFDPASSPYIIDDNLTNNK